jgi:4-hydroxyphenylpyruvate dioxygenase
MLYSIATVCISGMLKDKIEAIAKAGFKGIEIFENDLIQHKGSVSEIRKMIEDNGLKLIAYQPLRDFEGLPEPLRTQTFERAKKKLDLTAELGSDLLMVCSSCSPHSQAGISRAADDFAQLGDLAKQRGLKVAFEALAWGKHIHDYRDSWEIVRRANHDNVGLCLDTFHIFSRETEINAIENIPGDKIFLVQVADAPKLSMDHLSWSRHFRCFPGQGELKIDEFMEKLKTTGYDGPLSLEIFNDRFRSGSTYKNAADGYRSLVNLCNKKDDEKSTPLPKVQQPSKIEFLEFAINKTEKVSFSKILETLGFDLASTHKSKDVEHWQQNDINFILNCEDESFASGFRSKSSGLAVCAICLEVDSLKDMAKRADLLNYPIHYGDPLKDKNGNPSINGIAQCEMIFSEKNVQPSLWEKDFSKNDKFEGKSFLKRIDHLSIILPYGEMLESLLLCKSLFSMNTLSSVDIYDFAGLVQSQVMRTDNNNVNFAFNSTQAENTLAKKFLNKQNQGGIQQIALETKDIFEFAKNIKVNGIETLKLPNNYYEDLSARFLLDESILKTMEDLGILYDEDENGSFYQLYTLEFYGSFCFEIVQRNGYKGFGAANSPIRSTIQALELEKRV